MPGKRNILILLYQLLAGRYPSDALDLLDDSQWRDDRVSYQMRFFLAECLSPFGTERVPAGGVLAAEVEKLQKRWEMTGKDLFEEGKKAYQDAERISREFDNQLQAAMRVRGDKIKMSPPDVIKEREALSLLDLSVRKGHGEAGPLFEKAKKLAFRYPERTLVHADYTFRIGQYDMMRQSLDALRPVVANDLRYALDFQRWNHLCDVANLAMTEGVALRPHREAIADTLQGLSAGQISQRYARFYPSRHRICSNYTSRNSRRQTFRRN